MSEEKRNREEMMEDFEAMIEESLHQPQKGSIIKGTVAQINGNEVIVNIGYKTEGVVLISEFDEDIKIDDIVELAVVNFSGTGYVQLSRRSINEKSDWNNVKTASSDEQPVKVRIVSFVDKGYVGKIGEIDAFIPSNHIDIYLKNIDPKAFIGETLLAKVLKIDGRKKSALVSPRLYKLESIQKEKEDFFSQVKLGDKLKGSVKTIKDYGVFISFGAVDGFLHKNDILWGRAKNPAKYLSEGDEVEVVVLEVKDKENKISVGMKQLQEDPWSEVEQKYPIGSDIKGLVITRKRAGYVLEIDKGIDGFVPNEELSWLKSIRTTLNLKDVVEGRVVDYDNNHKRVIVSVKALLDNPWKDIQKNQPEGSVVKGKIKSITEFGLFIDFGSIIDGLVRKSDVSWSEEPKDLSIIYKEGDEIDVKILKIDEDKERISLGIKQLEVNPWKEIGKLLPVGKVVDTKICNITKAGIEVELPLNMKGFISQADLDPNNQSMDVYNIGDTLTAMVLKSNIKNKQIILSVKKYLQDSERKETREYMKKMNDNDSTFNFGSIFKDKFNK